MNFMKYLCFSEGNSRERWIDCSHLTTHGSSVYFTNSRDCCSILEKLDFSRSPTICGGTLKIRAISLIWNLRVSRNCACSGEMEIGVYFIRDTLVLVVPISVQLFVLRAEASISKPWTAGVSTGLLWTPWHIITSLYGHNKSPVGGVLPQGFRMFYFVHHNTIIRGDSQSLSFTLMMAATQERAVSCIR